MQIQLHALYKTQMLCCNRELSFEGLLNNSCRCNINDTCKSVHLATFCDFEVFTIGFTKYILWYIHVASMLNEIRICEF